MPTAEAFDAAARGFDRVADDLAQLLVATPSQIGPETLTGGVLTMVADLTVATAQITANSTSAALVRRADICRARAAACRAYAADLATYQQALDDFESAVQNYDPTDPFALAPARPLRPRPASFVQR